MRQKLTARKQGPNEPLDRYIEDLQHMFDNLELTEEEKVWFFTQGLHTYPEGSINATTKNLSIQTVQQSIKESQGGDALTRMQQQLDTIVSTMTKGPSKPEATVSAYQYSPQYTTTIDSKMTRLE